MFGSWVLELVIGLVFVFILFSTICAAIREGLEAWMKTRAAYLEQGIRELLDDPGGAGLVKAFYQHPLIYSLYSGTYQRDQAQTKSGNNLPSYIPAKNFSAALIDLAVRGPVERGAAGTGSGPVTDSGAITLDTLRKGAATIPNPAVARAMLSAIDLAGNDLDKVRLNIEAWYDSGMDRVSGWYRRYTNKLVFWLALVLAVALNIDTFAIANHLYRNDTARHEIVKQAEAELARRQSPAAPKPAPATAAAAEQAYRGARAQLDALNLPIGWPESGELGERELGAWLLAALGWLCTALAATLGAPFWFDVLNKVMVVRSTVKPHEKSQEESSEDRAAAPAAAAAPPAPPPK